jgi:predicted Rossmann-fold nucleotide-binding protein
MPGGFGTMDELFEAMTLNKKSTKFPIILVGSVLVWINGLDKNSFSRREHTVSPDDLNLFKIVDTEDEVVDVLDKFYKNIIYLQFLTNKLSQSTAFFVAIFFQF